VIRALAAAAAFAIATPAAAQIRDPRFISLTGLFDAVAQSSEGMPDAERVARFDAVMGRALPDFYRQPADQADAFARQILGNLRAYPERRAAILAASARMEQAYRSAGRRFRTFFPGYRADTPVYVLHSLGRMDGGTRTIGGRTALIFGADVIARIHDEKSIGPFLDHELFHTYHDDYFAECDTVWCGLWTEGLATYVALRLNPGADDRALLLTSPAPIRAPLDARFAEAACFALSKMDSEKPQDIAGFFQSNSPFPGWPARMGYYLGMRVAEQVGKGMPLDKLAKMPAAQVRPRIEAALRGFGKC
jgi:hypothetical protein